MPEAENVRDEADCFHLFMNNEILLKTENYTNRSIDDLIQAMSPSQREYVRTTASWIKTTSVKELNAFMGLQILRGAYQWNKMKVLKFWNEIPIFKATMSYKRYFFLSHMIAFDDKETRNQRWRRDRGAAIREIHEEWNDTLANAVYVGKDATIDESLYADREAIGFKVYLPNKPAKYGLLFKVIL